MENIIFLEKTRKGFPALWESGGGMANTGSARIIAKADGSAKKAVYLRGSGHLACCDHALVIVEPGDLVIDAEHHREDYRIVVYQIREIQQKENDLVAVVEPIHTFEMCEWDKEPPSHLDAAIDAAFEKAACYHCRDAHYVVVG